MPSRRKTSEREPVRGGVALKHAGLAEQPVGRAVFQLFFASHFYLRLCWLLCARSDFFSVPRSRSGKLKKRAVSTALLGLSLFLSRYIGWVHEDASTLRRALPARGASCSRASTPRGKHGDAAAAFEHQSESDAQPTC